jgi:S-(hydroxymethyl)glutathione dehydrogenase / alcohol dehydrogenase
MNMKAAVLWERRSRLKIEDVDLADLRPGEARVRILASGVCHSDLHHIRRESHVSPPVVLGHEGAGVVEAVAPDVTSVAVGERVIIMFGSKCGGCHFCRTGEDYLCITPPPEHSRLSIGGTPLTQLLSVGSFAEYSNVNASNLVRVPDDVPIESAALLACGVTTGLGAVINTARVKPGSNVAVIGIGGVGMNVVQGAALAGAARVIAVDVVERKLEMAQQFGATHLINANEIDPVQAIRDLTGGFGADYVFEVIGIPEIVRQAYDATRNGGMTVVVGVGPADREVSFNAFELMRSGKAIQGCFYGSVRPHCDVPRYIDLYRNGKIKLDQLITRRYRLDQINEAFDAMAAGEVARSVIVFDQ